MGGLPPLEWTRCAVVQPGVRAEVNGMIGAFFDGQIDRSAGSILNVGTHGILWI